MNLEGLAVARINLRAFDRMRIALRNPDLRPAWKEARPVLRKDQREHAKKQEGPEGSWAPRAASTKARAGRNGRARRMMGRLPTANRQKDERSRKIMSSTVAWSAVQATGGRVGRGSRLPARVFLYVSDRALETVAGIITRGIAFMIEVG